MTQKIAPKVLLIGWDAADWKVANPLMDAGRMPNLARFVEQGVMGNMATLHPPYSPMLWTSIATGVRPFKHGVLGFTEPTPDGQGVMPVSILHAEMKVAPHRIQVSPVNSKREPPGSIRRPLGLVDA